MPPAVGIDDLNLYAGSLWVDNDEVAAAQGLVRYADVVQIARRSVLPLFEDPVTLAVNAARPVVEAAGADAFDLLVVATESGLDLSKPLSSYVHRFLGLPSRCRHLEVKHACYAATLGVQLAADRIRSGAAQGRKALVIATDVAGWYRGLPAELTPGSGAVALAVAADPRILELEVPSGYASKEVYDTARPTATTHWIDEVLSLGAYLDLFEEAWAGYRAARGGGALEGHLDYVAYHTPLVSLVRAAHRLLLESDDGGVSDEAAAASFMRMVGPSLKYCALVGNICSGTLYTALAGIVDGEPAPPAGTRVGLFSYGSGSGAEFFSGRVTPDARGVLSGRQIARHLESRRRLTLEEYDRLGEGRQETGYLPDLVPPRELPEGLYEEAYRSRGLLVLERVVDHYRHYAWS